MCMYVYFNHLFILHPTESVFFFRVKIRFPFPYILLHFINLLNKIHFDHFAAFSPFIIQPKFFFNLLLFFMKLFLFSSFFFYSLKILFPEIIELRLIFSQFSTFLDIFVVSESFHFFFEFSIFWSLLYSFNFFTIPGALIICQWPYYSFSKLTL